jgi:hypothetical protein
VETNEIGFRTVFASAYVAARHSVYLALVASDPIEIARAVHLHHRLQLRYRTELTEAARFVRDTDLLTAVQAEIAAVEKEADDLRSALKGSGDLGSWA